MSCHDRGSVWDFPTTSRKDLWFIACENWGALIDGAVEATDLVSGDVGGAIVPPTAIETCVESIPLAHYLRADPPLV